MLISWKWIVWFVGIYCSVHLGASGSFAESIPNSWRADAELRDVFFIDRDFGWAVGDLGTIWHTQNGGEKWRQQSAGVHCQLSSVHFLDREQGWIVGGQAIPETRRSIGVVLQTQDGGRTWNRIQGVLLPWLTKVHFRSPRSGMAVGVATPLDPTGAWSTADGGATWSPLHGVSGEHWLDAAFSANGGFLIADSGRRARIQQERLVDAGQPLGAVHTAGRLAAAVDQQTAFAGQGTPQITVDGGNAWHSLHPLSPDPHSGFDWDAMAVVGEASWLAGSPGTRVFHSGDHARTFQPSFSNATLPLRALYFLDRTNGWAVGAYGLILRTEDGGQTWRPQRAAAKRAALLGVFADARSIPWQLIAQTTAVGEYRAHLVILCPSSRAGDVFDCPLEKRLQDAAQQIGASVECWRTLPLDAELDRSAGEVLRTWETQLPNPSDALCGRLTQLIRTWRPHVVVTSQTSTKSQGLASLLGQLLADASELAATEAGFPQQFAAQGLQPWTISRVLAVQADSTATGKQAERTTVLGSTVADLALRSQRLVQPGPAAIPSWSLISMATEGEAVAWGTNPLSGLSIPYDSASRRERTVAAIDLDRQKKTLRRRAHVRGLLQSGGALVGRGDHRREQMLQLLQTLERDDAGDLLYQLAEATAEQGDLPGSDRILRQLIARYPEHDLTDAALVWLIRYHTSLEQQWRTATPPTSEVQLVSAELPVEEGLEGDDLPTNEDRESVQNHVAEPRQRSWQQGFQLGRELKSKRPPLYAEPQVVFPLAAIARDDGQSLAAQAFYRRLLTLPAASHWRSRAAQELALLESSAVGVLRCVAVPQRPHLDGNLEDTCWQTTAAVTLGGEIAEGDAASTTLALAHDADFLYVALQCKKVAQVRYLPRRRPRPRDANLDEMDRVVLTLDVNRDYTSWWQLEIDHRGWTYESCLEDASWDPTYYVASDDDAGQWTAEIAIPLHALAPPDLRTGTHWAVGLTRIIPGTRVERWNPERRSSAPRSLQGLLFLE